MVTETGTITESGTVNPQLQAEALRLAAENRELARTNGAELQMYDKGDSLGTDVQIGTAAWCKQVAFNLAHLVFGVRE